MKIFKNIECICIIFIFINISLKFVDKKISGPKNFIPQRHRRSNAKNFFFYKITETFLRHFHRIQKEFGKILPGTCPKTLDVPQQHRLLETVLVHWTSANDSVVFQYHNGIQQTGENRNRWFERQGTGAKGSENLRGISNILFGIFWKILRRPGSRWQLFQ